MGVCDKNIVNQQGFRVRASAPVAAYFRMGDIQAFLLPTAHLTAAYVEDGWPMDYNQALIVASEDGTEISVANVTRTIQMTTNLDAYVFDRPKTATANQPFAYFVFGDYNGIPFMKQLLPKGFASTSFSLFRDYSLCNIWAVEGTAQVLIDRGLTNTTVQTDQPTRIRLTGHSAIEATAPIHIDCALVDYGAYGYPYPKESRISGTVQFYSFGDGPMLWIMTTLMSTGNILFDGKVLPILQWRRIPFTSDYYYQTQVVGPAGMHTLSTTSASDDDLYIAEISSSYGNSAYNPIAFNSFW